MRKTFFAILAFCLAARIIYFLYGITYNHYEGKSNNSGLNVFNKADAGWYVNIFNEGYPRISDKDSIGKRNGEYSIQSSWAFFPGYPYTIKTIAKIFSAKFNTAAFISLLLIVLILR